MRFLNFIALSLIFASINAHALVVYEAEDKKNSLSLFGRLEAGVYNQFSKPNPENNGKISIEGTARFGITGDYEIVQNIKALGFVEWEVASQTKDDGKFDTRYAFAGFDFSQYGVLVAGQGDTAQYLTVGFVDVFENYGAQATDYWTLGGRQEGQIMYSASVGNYTLTGSYQSHNNQMGEYLNHDYHVIEQLDVDYGFAGALSYNWDEGFLENAAFAVGYSFYAIDSDVVGDKRELNVALSYGFLNEGLYTALNYSRIKYQKEDHHSTGLDLVGGYAFENGIAFMLGYGYLGYEFDDAIESYAVGQLSYNFNDYFRVVAEGKFGVGDVDFPEKNSKQHDKYFVSLIYSF